MAKLDTVTARKELPKQQEPHWFKLNRGQYLGFRVSTCDTGSWIARFSTKPGQKYRALTEATALPPSLQFDAAKAAALAWFKHLDEGGEHENITVATVCARYVAHLRAEGRGAAADDAQARFRRYVLGDVIAKTPIQKLKPGQLADWRTKMLNRPVVAQAPGKPDKPRAKSTINRDMAVLKAALNLAFQDGYATNDATWRTKLTPFEAANGRRTVYLDAAQRMGLVKACPPDLGKFVQVLCMLPLRPGAAAALTAGSFDKATNVLTIAKDKAGAGRQIHLPASIADFLRAQCVGKLPGAPLFAQATGKPWDKDAWKKPFKAAALAAGLPGDSVTYSLRHSSITALLVEHKLDIASVATISGTSVLMIQKNYAHLLKEQSTAALDKLASGF